MALTDLYERSIFANLPRSENALAGRLGHTRGTPGNFTHATDHNSKGFDKISQAGQYVANSFPPLSQHAMGRTGDLSHIPVHSQLDKIKLFDNSSKLPGLLSRFEQQFPLNKKTHEVPEANNNLFVISNYQPLSKDTGLHELTSDGATYIRRPEVENHNNLLRSLNSFSNPQTVEITRGNPQGIPLVHAAVPGDGKFNYKSGIYNFNNRLYDIYNGGTGFVSSNRSGFLSQPYLETKLQGTPSTFNRLEATIRDNERIGKLLLDKPSIVARQIFLQGFNPTLETKTWNPLSLTNQNLGILGTTYQDRHSSGGLGSKLIDLIPGVNSPIPDVRTYEEALRKTPYQSRNVNQSPYAADPTRFDDPTGGLYRDKFFEKTKTELADLYTDTNPNKYKWPVGADGAGLPFSGRPSPKEQAERDKGLINIGAKFTKHIGFSKESPHQSKLKDLLPAVLTSIPGVSQINSAASILGFGKPNIGAEDRGNLFSNQYNPSFLYLVGNQIQNVPLNGEAPVGVGAREGALAFGTSPLTEILDVMTQTGEKSTKTGIKPAYTFLNKGDLKNALGPNGQFTEDRSTPRPSTVKTPALEDSRLKLDNYLQSYGEIGKKYESKSGGSIDTSRRQPRPVPAGTYLHYEAFKERSQDSTIRVNYGFAGKYSEYNSNNTAVDRISTLDVGEIPEDATPYLEEMIPFRFYHINEGRWIVFRAYLSGIVESNAANWNEKRYIGRADPVFTYVGATRKLNFSFDIHPESAQELAPLWKKVNAVVGLCWPTYIDIPRGQGATAGQYMLGPFVRLTIGDLYNQTPGIVNNVTITVDDVGTWETRRGVIDNIELAQLPKYVKINVDYTIIGKEIFDANANFFDYTGGFENNSQVDIAEALPRTG